MSKIDEKVANILNLLHRKHAEQLNARRKVKRSFAEGDKVWYRRPPNSGGKLDSRWLGPARILKRIGAQSYLIEVKEGVEISAHDSFLKLYFENEMVGEPIPLYYHQRTVIDEDAQPDEWEVDEVIDHKFHAN